MDEIQAFIDQALEGYRLAMWWQSSDENGNQIPQAEWSADALRDSVADVDAFVRANWSDVKQLGPDPGQVGHDFCLTRNRHGTGFWDRGLGERGDRLTDAAHVFREQDAYIGDDGLLYLN